MKKFNFSRKCLILFLISSYCTHACPQPSTSVISSSLKNPILTSAAINVNALVSKLDQQAAIANAAEAASPLLPPNMVIESLFGDTIPARPKFDVENVSGASLLVLGDEVDISSAYVKSTTLGAANVWVVARQIRIDEPAIFDLSGRPDGGSLTLVALDKFVGDQTISITADGIDGADNSKACTFNPPPKANYTQTLAVAAPNGGNGGQVRLFAGSGNDPMIKLTANAGKPGKGCHSYINQTYSVSQDCKTELIDFKGGGFFPTIKIPHTVCTPNEKMGVTQNYNEDIGAAGIAGVITKFKNINEVSQTLGREGSWQWMYGMLQKIEADALDAVRSESIEKIVTVFQKYKDLPVLSIPAEKIKVQSSLVGRLNALRAQALPPLWYKEIDVSYDGSLPQRVLLLTDSSTLTARIAPTTAVIRPISVQNNQRWGVVQINPQDPDRVVITLAAQLTADPRIANIVASQPENRFKIKDGVFTRWALSGQVEPVFGLDLNSTKVNVYPDNIVLSLVVSASSANLVLYMLTTAPGIRLNISWRMQDQNGTVVEGPGFPVFVTLNTRQALPIIVADGNRRISNNSNFEVAVSYLIGESGVFTTLSPEPRLAPGASVELDPKLSALGVLGAPPEAIKYVVSSSSVYDLFAVNADPALMQEIRVANLLPFYNDKLNDTLRYVEVFVETWDQAVPATKTRNGPYRLAPAGAQGDEIKLQVLRLPNRTIETKVTGQAVYAGGSLADMTPIESTDLALKIQPDQFH